MTQKIFQQVSLKKMSQKLLGKDILLRVAEQILNKKIEK